MKSLASILLMSIFASAAIAHGEVRLALRDVQTTPANGGFNPDYRGLRIEATATVRNGCMSARLEQELLGSLLKVYAVSFNASPGSLCTQALKDVQIDETIVFHKATKVLLLNADGQKEVVLAEPEDEAEPTLVDTWVRSAWISFEDNRMLLTAELFAGSNPCVAKGVKVGWSEYENEGRTIIAPHRTVGEARICTREYNPQFHLLSTELTSPIQSTDLKHFKNLEASVAIAKLVPILQSIRSGGFCRGRCPKTIQSLLRNGSARRIEITYDYENPFDAQPTVTVTKLKGIDQASARRYLIQTVWLRPGELVDQDAGTPICMDAPSTRYNAFNYWYAPIAIGKWENCHQFSLDQAPAKALIEVIQNLPQ